MAKEIPAPAHDRVAGPVVKMMPIAAAQTLR
jgi:hypothetical protein